MNVKKKFIMIHRHSKFLCFIYLLAYSLYSSGQENHTLYGNSHFNIHDQADSWEVESNKMLWEALSIPIDGVQDSVSQPRLVFGVRANENTKLLVEFIHLELGIKKERVYRIRKGARYSRLNFDLSDVIGTSTEAIGGFLKLTVDPGQCHSGKIEIRKGIKWKSNASQEPPVAIYPNPASDYIKLSFDDKEYKSLWMYNRLSGKVVKRRVPPNRKHMVLNVSNFPRGMYFLRLQGGKDSSDTYRVRLN